ncbi:uncharacterized protein [Arachis hypogaea]
MLFNFFCDVSNNGTVLLEELISKSLCLKQSRLYSENAIEEGLVVDGNGVILVPNVSNYVLSQVILFLEKKRHFQEAVDAGATHYEGWPTTFFNQNSHILSDLQQAAQDLQIPSLMESIAANPEHGVGKTVGENLGRNQVREHKIKTSRLTQNLNVLIRLAIPAIPVGTITINLRL